MTENELAKIIFKKGLEVHRQLGPGLLESAYEECLQFELMSSGLFVERQKRIPIEYKDRMLRSGFVADLVINGKVIVELKSVNSIAPVHVAQVLTYLRLTDIRLGLLINFNVPLFKEGVRRIVNGI